MSTIQDISLFLSSIYGQQIRIEECPAPKGLPLYLVASRHFYQVILYDVDFIIVEFPEESSRRITNLSKDLSLYEKCAGCSVAFGMTSVTRDQQRSMIRHRIPFIAVNKQLFLPFLGMYLKEYFPTKKDYSTETMMPSTQMLFLYLLYGKSKSVPKFRAADDLFLTRTSLTRASRQLVSMGLIEEKRVGKEIHIIPVASGRDYYEMAKDFLIDPVSKTVTVATSELAKLTLPMAGESALSNLSMLNPPRIASVGLYKGADELTQLNIVDERWTEEEVSHIELWKYPPEMFARNGNVDIVSLSCSLRNIYDERVEGELKRVMEEFSW